MNNTGFEFNIELTAEQEEILLTMYPNDSIEVIKDRLIEKA